MPHERSVVAATREAGTIVAVPKVSQSPATCHWLTQTGLYTQHVRRTESGNESRNDYSPRRVGRGCTEEGLHYYLFSFMLLLERRRCGMDAR